MKIQKVKIKDFKVIKNLDEEINGKNIILLGDNGVGKSSLMQFIEIALGRMDNIPPNATGEGEVITDKNGEQYKFQVRFKDGKPQVTVISPNGLKDSRKSAIASIVGAIDFDINEFVSLSDSVPGRRKQVDIYKSMLSQEVVSAIANHEKNIEMHYENRTQINREINNLKGYLRESELYGSHLKLQPFDATELQKKIQYANDENEKISIVKHGIEARKESISTLEDEKKRILKRVKEIDDAVFKANKEISDGNEWLKDHPEIDTKQMFDDVANASEQNRLYAEAQELIKKEKKIEELEQDSGELTALIDSSKQAIEDVIKSIESPVDGLSFGDDGLIYNGIPVNTSSLSTSEIIHLGCKMKMAQNSGFGVLLIEHGESIGTERLKQIQDLAKKNDWQIIMEQVERGTGELKIEIMAE